LRRRADNIDDELEHRIAEPVDRFAERPADHRDIARDSPHGQEDRSHGRTVEQRKKFRISHQGQCGIDIRICRYVMGWIERIRVAGQRLDDERHRIGARQRLPIETRRDLGLGLRRAERADDEHRRDDHSQPWERFHVVCVDSHGISLLFEWISLQQAEGDFQIKWWVGNVQGLGSAIISWGGTNWRL